MKKYFLLIAISAILLSCSTRNRETLNAPIPLTGTWKLISGTLIENGDTTITDYTQGISFIKIINETHFAFLQHDLHQGKDSSAVFVAGGGKYVLSDSLYTENLEYCSAREWEDNSFAFVVSVRNDTLVQTGIEKVEEAGINRLNIERYIRVKN